MTEFQELAQDAPNFVSMERGELVAYAYGMFAAGTKANVENVKLRELLTFYLGCLTKGHVNCDSCAFAEDVCGNGRKVIDWARKLGVEVDE